MIKGVAKVSVLEFVCFYIFNLSIIFLNFILIVFFINYLGDALRASAFATRFFLSYLVFVFQFKHKTTKKAALRSRENRDSITIENPHNTINYITINNSISYREPYHFRYNRRNNLGAIFNLLLVKFMKNTPIRLKWRKTMRPKRLYKIIFLNVSHFILNMHPFITYKTDLFHISFS